MSDRPRYGLRGAVQFLTRIPVKTATAPDLGAAVAWFPVVGAAIGLVCGLCVAALSVVVPMGVAATLGVLAGVLLTGAFHEDGLADVADAFAGGWTREERLAILDDPRHGTYGVAALVGSIVARVACVAVLSPALAVGGLVAAHCLGRATAVAAMSTAPRAAGEGLGAEYIAASTPWRRIVAVAVAIAIAALAIGVWVAPAVGAAAFAGLIVVILAVRRIGGLSGDVLGAIEQVAETAVLVVVAAAAHRTTAGTVPWWD